MNPLVIEPSFNHDTCHHIVQCTLYLSPHHKKNIVQYTLYNTKSQHSAQLSLLIYTIQPCLTAVMKLKRLYSKSVVNRSIRWWQNDIIDRGWATRQHTPNPFNSSQTHSTGPQTMFLAIISNLALLESQKLHRTATQRKLPTYAKLLQSYKILTKTSDYTIAIMEML